MRSTSPAAHKAQVLSKNARNAEFIGRRQGASERGAEEGSESDKGIKIIDLDLEEEEDDDLPPLLWFLEDAVESVTKFLSGTSLSSYMEAATEAADNVESLVLPSPYPSSAPASLPCGYVDL